MASREGLRDEAFSEVTGERAPSFRDLSLGKTPAIPKGGMRRGRTPPEISRRKDQPGASERKKRLPP